MQQLYILDNGIFGDKRNCCYWAFVASHYVCRFVILFSILGILILNSCKENKQATTLFQKLEPSETNIHFSNDLSYDAKFNIYTYRNFYNGGGVAIGDINNDGLPDIFFTANMMRQQTLSQQRQF